jgi:hypothetical protein
VRLLLLDYLLTAPRMQERRDPLGGPPLAL